MREREKGRLTSGREGPEVKGHPGTDSGLRETKTERRDGHLEAVKRVSQREKGKPNDRQK